VTYVVTWSRDKRQPVASVAQLDAVLDEIASRSGRYSVGIYRPEDLDNPVPPWEEPPHGALELGVGDPDRSFVVFVGAGGGVGTDPGMPPWPDGAPDIAFDYGGDPVFCGPDRARVRPETARQAAREFVATGQRPTCLAWGQ
jgi:hypothetical protein